MALLNFDGQGVNPPPLFQGADYNITFQLLSDEGEPLDLTGWTEAHLVARTLTPKYADDPTIFDLVPGSGLTVTDIPGTIEINIPKIQTQAVVFIGRLDPLGRRKQEIFYDFFLTDPAGRRFKLLYGTMIVYSSVTPFPQRIDSGGPQALIDQKMTAIFANGEQGGIWLASSTSHQDSLSSVIANDGDPVMSVPAAFGSGSMTAPSAEVRPLLSVSNGVSSFVMNPATLDDLRVPMDAVTGHFVIGTTGAIYSGTRDYAAGSRFVPGSPQSIGFPQRGVEIYYTPLWPVVGVLAIDRTLTDSEIRDVKTYFSLLGANDLTGNETDLELAGFAGSISLMTVDPMPYNADIVSLPMAFEDNYLTEIPQWLFSSFPNLVYMVGTFTTNSLETLQDSFITQNLPHLLDIRSAFTINAPLFSSGIPANFFTNLPLHPVSRGFEDFWDNYTTLLYATGVPKVTADVFANPPASFDTFVGIFSYCANLTEIEAGAFDALRIIGPAGDHTKGFEHSFEGCVSLSIVPAHLFDLQSKCVWYHKTFKNCALTQESMDNALVSIAYAATTNNLHGGLIDYWSGASPSSVGLAAAASLRDLGWAVTLP